MITSILKGMLFVIVMAFYSLCVWRVVNDYFRNEFKSYIDQDPLLAAAAGRQRVANQPVHPSLQQVLQAAGNVPHPAQSHRPPQIHEILGQGVDHRDAAKFREHVASLSRQLNAKHQPVVVQVDKDELLQRLSPDLSEQIQKAVDASFDGDSQLGTAEAMEPHKYAVVVFDDELPEENGDDEANEVNGPQLTYDDGDDYDGTLDADDVGDGDAFIAVPTNRRNPAPVHAHRPVISALDGGAVGTDGGADNGANQMLVTNDLGDGSLDDVRRPATADADDSDDSSGDNELIMAIDGNLIKSSAPLVAHRVEVMEAAVAAARRTDATGDGAVLTEDCLCVREGEEDANLLGMGDPPVN